MASEWRVWSILCGALLVLAAFFQTKLFLSPDVSYLLYAATQLLHGGNYVSDFFETNPPMILYLYLPACLLAKYFALNVVNVIRFYVLFLVMCSSGLSFYLLKKIIHKKNDWFLYFITFMMLSVLLFLPLFELGQREHLFLILTMPYYFSTVLFLEKKPISLLVAILIGVIAGLGIALKPFFLMPFFLIELYVMIQKRSLFSWLRVEPIVIVSIIFAYLIFVMIFHAAYFTIILPLVFHFYFSGVKNSWLDLLTDPLFCFCILAVLSYLIFSKKINYRPLNSIFCVALIGMMIAFLIPRTDWYYHLLPALSMAYLLIASCVSLMIVGNGNEKYWVRDGVIGFVCAIVIFAFPVFGSLKYFVRFNKGWHPSEVRLAEALRAEKGKHSIYCITTLGTYDCFPLVYDTNSQFSGRFPFFWWYSGLEKSEKSKNVSIEKKFLIDAFSDDLNRYQARWIVVNMYSFKDWQTESLKLASENKLYRDAWKHYHYSMTIDHYQIYTRD